MSANQELSGFASAVLGRKRSCERLYALMDSARDSELVAAASRAGEIPYSLFGPAAPDFMLRVAPRLATISIPSCGGGDEFLDAWEARLGRSVGLLLATEADPPALLRHLSGLFQVTDEDRLRYYFRFYDPRVLRSFLPTCSALDAAEFFGPIRRIFVEDEKPGRLLIVNADDGLRTEILPFASSGSSEPIARSAGGRL